jgi:hypothetical protein
MPIEQIVHRHHVGHRHRLPAADPLAQPQTRRSEATGRVGRGSQGTKGVSAGSSLSLLGKACRSFDGSAIVIPD